MGFFNKVLQLLRGQPVQFFKNKVPDVEIMVDVSEFGVSIGSASDFEAAGVVFTDGRTILAGYQIHKENPYVSGIGGKREAGETYMTTAIREMLEEIFDIPSRPELIEIIRNNTTPTRIIQTGTYIMVVYDFTTLDTILRLLSNIKSPVYKKHPKNLNELIFKRISSPTAEISHLCLLPVIHHPKIFPFVDDNLLNDIDILRKLDSLKSNCSD
jgi:hypothetical protein